MDSALLGRANSRHHALPYQLALELRDGGQHVELELAARRAEVQRVAQGDEG